MVVLRSVILVGFQDQGNLGIGYLASTLISEGYRVQILDIRQEPKRILAVARSTKPILIGFSLIFQYYLSKFASLASYLRIHGVQCHFCMGGHYPSLRYENVLEAVPELDCVVRFEGELTLLELVRPLAKRCDWRETLGIAYRQSGEVITTPIRPLIGDLDKLPYPYRPFSPEHVLGKKATPILASRGCVRSCSFCSIRRFYSIPPGKTVRRRKPSNVVKEMKVLCDQQGISIFLFQDDDFPLLGPAGRHWALDFVNELRRQELSGRVIWKISCRADEIEPELFASLRDGGLYLVYLGLESGTDAGLKALNKQLSVGENLRAVSILKELGLMFEFGFMLFDPLSTFDTVRANVAFLRRIVGDGSSAVTFCRMLPYGGTPIEDELARGGRLRGDVSRPDYDFLDQRLNLYFDFLTRVVVPGWIQGPEAVSPQLNWAWHEVAVIERLFPFMFGLEEYKNRLRSITKASNEFLLNTIEDTSLEFERGPEPSLSAKELRPVSQHYVADLFRWRNEFVGCNQDLMLEALSKDKRVRL